MQPLDIIEEVIKPLMVMFFKYPYPGIAAPAVVMMTEVVVVAPHVAVKPATLLPPAATVGVTEGMKKPEGYVKVMVPPGGIRPNNDVLNDTFKVTLDARSEETTETTVKSDPLRLVGSATKRYTPMGTMHAKISTYPIFHLKYLLEVISLFLHSSAHDIMIIIANV
jgi:hypothetical protein